MKQMSLAVATLGTLSFIFGVIAENKKVLFFLNLDTCFIPFCYLFHLGVNNCGLIQFLSLVM